MREPMEDAEQIAALLDGRLDARQRAEVLARLGESEAAMEAFADAAAVVQAPRASHWRLAGLALAASVLLAVALISVLRSRQAISRDPGQFIASLPPGISGMPSGWNGTPWSVTRGEGEQLTAEARASRIGARLVDLDVASRSGDSSASRIATDIASLLDPLPASAPVAAIYRALSGSMSRGAQRDSLLAIGRAAATDMAGADAVELGAWTEAARLAAAQHDSAFFRSAASREMLPRVGVRIPAADRAINWESAEDALTTRLEALAR
jgi:hypothetical protein